MNTTEENEPLIIWEINNLGLEQIISPWKSEAAPKKQTNIYVSSRPDTWNRIPDIRSRIVNTHVRPHTGIVRLFNTRNTRVTLPHLGKVYHLVSNIHINGAGLMVQVSHARQCFSGVAGVETNEATIVWLRDVASLFFFSLLHDWFKRLNCVTRWILAAHSYLRYKLSRYNVGCRSNPEAFLGGILYVAPTDK